MLSAKWRPFCPARDELNAWTYLRRVVDTWVSSSLETCLIVPYFAHATRSFSHAQCAWNAPDRPLHWRFNERGGISNHRRFDCLLQRLRNYTSTSAFADVSYLMADVEAIFFV